MKKPKPGSIVRTPGGFQFRRRVLMGGMTSYEAPVSAKERSLKEVVRKVKKVKRETKKSPSQKSS